MYHLSFFLFFSQGGLYVLGHVVTKPFDTDVAEYYNRQLTVWLDFVDISKVKAFVELSISDSVRAGARNLLTVSAFVVVMVCDALLI